LATRSTTCRWSTISVPERCSICPLGAGARATVAEAPAEGAHCGTVSGDKLSVGPQAGFIGDRQALIPTINRNPMQRALRVDKMLLAAL
jgi:L-seryl-tRNA(Ser) seleniumtransferase